MGTTAPVNQQRTDPPREAYKAHAAHTSPPQIAVLIPAYNEATRVGAVVGRARTYLPVTVIDDGSADDTAATAGEAGADVVQRSPNQGKGAALKAGFHWAIREGLDAVITLDADGQHEPEAIPAFLEKRDATDADLVIGYRDYRRMPPQRRLSNTLSRWIISWSVGVPVPDNQSGYRLISRRMMEAVLASPEQGFAFEVEMIALCVRLGYRLEWVPINTIYAGETSHIRVRSHVTGFLRVALRARRVVRGK
jgi:glycosyltransferase involved in cell wall biosynthesis